MQPTLAQIFGEHSTSTLEFMCFIKPWFSTSIGERRSPFSAAQMQTHCTQMPPYVLILLSMSYRIHSIFALRLFNDPVAMLLFYTAANLFMSHRWTIGCTFFRYSRGRSLAILTAIQSRSLCENERPPICPCSRCPACTRAWAAPCYLEHWSMWHHSGMTISKPQSHQDRLFLVYHFY